MSWSIEVAGHALASTKQAVIAKANEPHSYFPGWAAKALCAQIETVVKPEAPANASYAIIAKSSGHHDGGAGGFQQDVRIHVVHHHEGS